MNLIEFKHALTQINELLFVKPDGSQVPTHFHITEVGQVQKRFIDCGGTIRNEGNITMQLWDSTDFDHRLAPTKLLSIINLSISKLGIENLPIEIEYQSDTIGKYGVAFINGVFQLTTTATACLASDNCGVTTHKEKINLAELPVAAQPCCAPGSGCC